MKNKVLPILICICGILFFASCNLTKLVPKDDALYTGATVKIKDSTLNKKQKKFVLNKTEDLPRPRANAKFLGIPFKLILYNLSGNPKKGGFIRKFLRKTGEPPVLLSSLNLDYNIKLLTNYQQNIGYFDAESTGDTIVKNRKGHAYYDLTPGLVYTIKNVIFPPDTSSLLHAMMDTQSKSILHSGDPFNLEVIKGERIRIDAVLKEKGYYYFSPEQLEIVTDSAIGEHSVNLYPMVKRETPEAARKPYVIDDVYIYPNFRLNSALKDTAHKNEVLYNGYYIIDPQKKFNPKLFPRIMLFDSGDVYNRTNHNLTLSRLINLDVFKFVKNRFEDSPNSEGDTGRLNTYYYLTPLPKKSLRAEINGNTKSNNFLGTLFTATFRNRNTFKGAEHLDIYGNVGSEVQYSGSQSGYNTYRLGGGIKFTIPRFVVPFFHFNTTNAFVPKTVINLSYDLLNRRKLYTLNSLKGELGYNWKPNLKVQQEFNPISINYVHAINITQKYLDSLRGNPLLQHAIDTQFIIGSNYSYTIDPLVNDPFGTGYYFSGLGDLSGNVAGLLVKGDGKDGMKRIVNTPFAQYIKTQLDFRYYYALNEKARLANRIITGVGYPYGNSKELPFIKQFFIGGNNSLRAFRSRSVGPGIYRNPKADNKDSVFLPDESGDIKLELNTEFRYRFNKIIEGAFFVDAGNIWLYKKDTSRVGAEFSKNFMKELAVGTGIGLRLNFTILLLRLDLAMPLRKPWLPDGNRWVINQIDFGSKEWRRKNLVLNLAIGYPF
ncbi:MAG: BamA/TamA family outer membrane protein [Ginsengibacter sp.]